MWKFHRKEPDNMKKIVSLFLVLLMIFSLISCADNRIEPPETTGNGSEVTTQPETTEAPVGEYVLRHKFADIDELEVFGYYTIYIMLRANFKIEVHDREAW